MDKRLEKRHKREVARAKHRVKVSEPDVRTPEQLAAAREASRTVSSVRNDAHTNYFTPSASHARSAGESASNVETGS